MHVVGRSRMLRQTYQGEWVAWRPGIPPGPGRRLLDVTAAGLALLVLSPILVCAALAIRLTGGPALFRQVRAGQGGVPFTMYKFRTMVPGPPGSLLTALGDSRVTRLGRLLRATNVDELPQLLNILRGDMTLVGFRPETVSLAAGYPPECRRVFQFRPGLTGPSQLRMHDREVLDPTAADLDERYLREVVPRRVELDLEYLEHPSMRRTVALLIETALPARVRRTRASTA